MNDSVEPTSGTEKPDAQFVPNKAVDSGFNAAKRPPSAAEQAVLEAQRQAAVAQTAPQQPVQPSGSKKIDLESRELLKQISQDFVMFTGAGQPLAYHTERGTKLSKDSFIQYCDKHYGGIVFIDSTGAQTDRTSAGSIWWAWSDHSRRVVDTIVMEPTNTPENDSDPETYNRWYELRKSMVPPNYEATQEDAAPFMRHLMLISDGDEIGVMYFLNWLAQLYQFPDTKIPVAILMYSQFGGVGKNLVQKLLTRVFGKKLVAGVSGKRLNSNFMDAIEHKRLIFINELARSDRADGYEDFKTQISEEDTQFEGKGRAAREVRNIAHYIITTNNIDCLPLMQNDRRIAVLMTVEQPQPAEYYRGFVKWINGPGPAIVANLLRTWQFPADWDPYSPAPQTIAAKTMQREAQGELFATLEEMRESRVTPFDRRVVTAKQVSLAVKEYAPTLKCSAEAEAVGKRLEKMDGVKKRRDKVLRKDMGQREANVATVYLLGSVEVEEWWKGLSPAEKGDYLDTGRLSHRAQVQSSGGEVINHE